MAGGFTRQLLCYVYYLLCNCRHNKTFKNNSSRPYPRSISTGSLFATSESQKVQDELEDNGNQNRTLISRILETPRRLISSSLNSKSTEIQSHSNLDSVDESHINSYRSVPAPSSYLADSESLSEEPHFSPLTNNPSKRIVTSPFQSSSPHNRKLTYFDQHPINSTNSFMTQIPFDQLSPTARQARNEFQWNAGVVIIPKQLNSFTTTNQTKIENQNNNNINSEAKIFDSNLNRMSSRNTLRKYPHSQVKFRTRKTYRVA